MPSNPHGRWNSEAVADAVDRGFAKVARPTIADMIAAAKHCHEQVAVSGRAADLDDCVAKWIQENGLQGK